MNLLRPAIVLAVVSSLVALAAAPKEAPRRSRPPAKAPDAPKADRPRDGGKGSEVVLPPEMDVPVVPVPPAPPLSPEAALKTLRVAPGFKVELVAAEPLVQDPVAIHFDADGRLWVCEMRGYMPDVDGTNETAPIGSVSFLEDTNGDGRMDKRTVFLEGLVLPRAATPYRDGVLVAAPPYAWFCRDTDGDGKSDEQTLLATDYDNKSNPEHQPNGLMPGLDNWIHNAQWGGRFRFVGNAPQDDKGADGRAKPAADPRWVRQATPSRGQWGITQDDVGRLYYDTNSDQLRGDHLPPWLVQRNPNHVTTAGINLKIAEDQRVYPIRPTPGINRGYQPKMLDEEGKLRTFTAACGPHVYRGDLFPPEFYGNAFVCEPSAHLVKRNVMSEKDGVVVTARNTHYTGPDGKPADFLASTDERFRPVFLNTGPDGALYVCDLYRGVLQHIRYVTPYLRKQIKQRDLEQPLHMGRIYRIVPATPGAAQRLAKAPGPSMLKAPAAELVPYLSHPNGWWRDNAQQQIVARGDESAAAAVRQVLTGGRNPLGRLHALYTLEGMNRLQAPAVKAALEDKDARVRVAALRLAEPMLKGDAASAELVPAILKLAKDERADVRLQFLFTASTLRTPQTRDAVVAVYEADAQRPYVRDAVLSGLHGNELEFLGSLLEGERWVKDAPGRGALLGGLAACVFREGKPDRVSRLLAMADVQSGPAQWRQAAIIQGVAPLADAKGKAPKPVALEAQPPVLAKLAASDNAKHKQAAAAVAKLLTWPGKASAAPAVARAKPLTKQEQASFERGKLLFSTTCAACHMPDALGSPGKAPSMRGSEILLGHEVRPIRVVLHGLRGPVNIAGETAEMEMPTLAALNDEQIADVLTYARNEAEWGHAASAVTPAAVAKVREETKDWGQPWTKDQLKALKLPGDAKPAGKPRGRGAPGGDR